MLIKGIREHITNNLDTIVGVLMKFDNGVVSIQERIDKQIQTKLSKGKKPLLGITVYNIPKDNVWIFENEFGQQLFSSGILNNQKKAYESSGKKVEKTIILHRNRKLYFFMVEMKETMNVDKFTESKDKFESSLATMSIYLSAHSELSTFEDSEIYPIGVCCYNYEDLTITDAQNDNLGDAGKDFRDNYKNGRRREFTTKIHPLTLKEYEIPIVFCPNPNNPLTTSFEIDFEEIIQRAEAIAATPTNLPPKTLNDNE